jgi:hypothetical protein
MAALGFQRLSRAKSLFFELRESSWGQSVEAIV